MRRTTMLTIFAAFVFSLLSTQEALAGSLIYGYSSISYNAATNVVTGYSTTELDFAAQDWYKGRVNSLLFDPNTSATFSSGTAADNDRDGTVTVTTQATGASGVQYHLKSTHFAELSIQDYAIGAGYYLDYWSYQPIFNGEDYRYVYMPFFGPGPSRRTTTRNLTLGKTYARFDLDLPPRATATAASFDPKEVAKNGGQSSLNVEVSTTRATPEGSKITVEIQVESNPGQVDLEITTFTKTIEVGPGKSGQVVIAPFPVKTSANNQAGGFVVTFRATITSAVNPAGQPIQIGGPPTNISTVVSGGLTVKK